MFWLLTGIDDLKPDAEGLYPDNDSLRIVYIKKENAASVKIFEENAKLMNGEKVTYISSYFSIRKKHPHI
jgi:mannan endo-1,4-beta-mannosidase